MKNFFFLSLIVLSIAGCNSKGNQMEGNNQTDAATAESASPTTLDSAAIEEPVAQLYACPMHPEIKGKKGEDCSKCGMELTEPVK